MLFFWNNNTFFEIKKILKISEHNLAGLTGQAHLIFVHKHTTSWRGNRVYVICIYVCMDGMYAL